MKTFAAIIAVLAACTLSGCITSSHGDRRVVELPKGDPDATLATAQKICVDLIAAGFANDLHNKFPSLTPAQMQGVFLTANEGTFQTGPSVFILTGITYSGSLPEAKDIADYCESAVRKAVSARLPKSSIPPST